MKDELKKIQKYENECPKRRPITEKELEVLLENMIKLEFDTEETMKAYFKAEYKKIIAVSQHRWEPKKKQKPNVDDNYMSPIDFKDREFERGGKSWSIRKYALTKAEFLREWEFQNQ